MPQDLLQSEADGRTEKHRLSSADLMGAFQGNAVLPKMERGRRMNKTCEDCLNKSGFHACAICEANPSIKKQTNADRIRQMTDEELAKYLDGVCHDLWQMFVADPEKTWLEWLKKEADDG